MLLVQWAPITQQLDVRRVESWQFRQATFKFFVELMCTHWWSSLPLLSSLQFFCLVLPLFYLIMRLKALEGILTLYASCHWQTPVASMLHHVGGGHVLSYMGGF